MVSRVDLDDEQAIRDSERSRMIALLFDNLDRGAFNWVRHSNFNLGMKHAIALIRGSE